ncbi:MAG: hypothetical protein MAG431_02104 [Chloroflexi bacterium]|nr:hypothetical protein [Chloroflexota bacterium]
MNSFSRSNYEGLIYSLSEEHPEITSSTLRLYTNSSTSAILRGSIYFRSELELRIFEYIDLTDGEIFEYNYAVYRGNTKVRWYDSQPHPEDQDLASTFPHHYHEEPNIKNNRKPAPGISFKTPNLPTLITSCLNL